MGPRRLFRDRLDAGRVLASHLRATYRGASPIVVGLPRGGVPVAYEVARELGAPLDVCVVRKLGAPIEPELGIGAVSEGDVVFVDPGTKRYAGVSDEELAALVTQKRAEVAERVKRFRRGEPPVEVKGETVLVVDDGVATGGTARAALQALRARGAARVVLAVPVGASESIEELASVADEIVCLHQEDPFYAVGLWYEDFTATTDDDVVELLDRARAEHAARAGAHEAPPHARRSSGVAPAAAVAREVRIPVEGGELEGTLAIPPGACGVVLFAHGSGSSRHSTRNRQVAHELQREGVGTLLFDLLTEDEDRIDARTAHLRFDIGLLGDRLVAATDWIVRQPEMASLPIGYFGASTGAAAALVAAAARPSVVHAIVSRGGRPDLAEPVLSAVHAPTLLLVGGADEEVLRLNREALALLACVKELEIVPGATHLFEEPGALGRVARSAARWFVHHLGRRAAAATA